MAEISKPDYTYIWASGGSVVTPSSVKMQTGWTSEVPPYQWENYLQNRQDKFNAHVNQHGICVWDGLSEYIANKSYVQGSDGLVYKAVQNSGPSTTVKDPTLDTTKTYWNIAFANYANALTVTAGDARYLQILNNGSDVNNAATFRQNIGVLPASESVAGLLRLATTAEAQNFTANRAIDGAKLADAFKGINSMISASGYQKLPNGLIIQWGTGVSVGTTVENITITLPTAWPTGSFAEVATVVGGMTGTYTVTRGALTTSTMKFTALLNGAYANAINIRWLAIGY